MDENMNEIGCVSCVECEYRTDIDRFGEGCEIPPYRGVCVRPGGPCDEYREGSGAAVDEPLTYDEQQRLAELEAIVGARMMSVVEFGAALAEIRDRRLYRQAHGSFDTYVKERFEVARATAYQYIEAAAAFENVRNCGRFEILPANEAQIRPLTRVDGPVQVQVWKRVTHTSEVTGEPVTARLVAASVREVLGEQFVKRTGEIRTRVQRDPVIPDDFKERFFGIMEYLREAREANWRGIDRAAALRYLDALKNILAE